MGFKLVTWWMPGRNVYQLQDENTGFVPKGGTFEIKWPIHPEREREMKEGLTRLKAEQEAEDDKD